MGPDFPCFHPQILSQGHHQKTVENDPENGDEAGEEPSHGCDGRVLAVADRGHGDEGEPEAGGVVLKASFGGEDGLVEVVEVALGDSEADAEDEPEDEGDDGGEGEGVLLLDALEAEEPGVVDVAVGAEPDRPGGGVDGHGDQGPEDEVYFGHHEDVEHIVDLVYEVQVLVLVVAGVLHSLQILEGMGQDGQDLQQEGPDHALIFDQFAEDALAGISLGNFSVNSVLVDLQLQFHDFPDYHEQDQHAGGAADDGHEGSGHFARGKQVICFYFYHSKKYGQ